MKFILIILFTTMVLVMSDAVAQFKPAQVQYLTKENLATNGGFEQGKKGWTNSAGTFSIDNTKSVIGKNGGCISLTAQNLDFSQTLSSGYNSNLSGVQGVVSGYVRADVSGGEICSLVDGSEQSCVSINGNSKFDHYAIPTVLGSTSLGIKLKGTSLTGQFCMDGTEFGVDSKRLTNVKNCTGELDCENSFNARVSSTDAVTKENLDWINGNCTNATTGRATCTFNSDIFTVAPNCFGSVEGDYTNSSSVNIISVSNTQVVIETVGTAGSFDTDFSLHCEKQGADFQKSESSIVANLSEVCQVFANNNSGETITQDTEDIPWSASQYDNCNAWDNSGNTGANTADAYTAQKNGFVSAHITINQTASGTTNPIRLYENGTEILTCGSTVSSFSRNGATCNWYATLGNVYTWRITNTNITLGSSTAHNIYISEFVGIADIIGKFKEYLPIKGCINCQKIKFTRAGSTGVVTSFLGDNPINGNCTIANPSVCTFNEPFASSPICIMDSLTSGRRDCGVAGATSTTVSIQCFNGADAVTTTSTTAIVECEGEM